jgi:hypothetical protein
VLEWLLAPSIEEPPIREQMTHAVHQDSLEEEYQALKLQSSLANETFRGSDEPSVPTHGRTSNKSYPASANDIHSTADKASESSDNELLGHGPASSLSGKSKASGDSVVNIAEGSVDRASSIKREARGCEGSPPFEGN